MPAANLETLCDQIRLNFSEQIEACQIIADQLIVDIKSAHLVEVATALRDQDIFAFEQLIDLCGVDYSSYGQSDWQTESATSSGFSRGVTEPGDKDAIDPDRRFAVVYQLLSLRHNQRLRLRVFAKGEPPIVPSLVDIWASANWNEREVFDLFGVLFDGHPDLRRILTDYGFIGHPFRKDFPLEGNVEVRYDEKKGRVIYQPVTIENRVLVPRVIRDDGHFGSDQARES